MLTDCMWVAAPSKEDIVCRGLVPSTSPPGPGHLQGQDPRWRNSGLTDRQPRGPGPLLQLTPFSGAAGPSAGEDLTPRLGRDLSALPVKDGWRFPRGGVAFRARDRDVG